jgi:hypothetical protein
MADVRFIVTVDSATATANIQKLDESWNKLSKGQTEVGKTTAALDKGMGSLWKQIAAGVGVVSIAQKSLGFIKKELFDSVRQASDYERSFRGMEAAFAISGRTMPGMVKNLKEYAASIERLGLAEDDEILRVQSMLLQFTNLNENGLKAATRGAIGLASVFGMDLQSAAQAVKNGTEGNFRALQMLIPEIRQATTEEGKRAAMMKAFDELYSRAITDTETYAGKVKALGLAWKNAKQELGASILETGILQAITEETSLFLKDAALALSSYSGKLREATRFNNEAGIQLEKMAEALGWEKTELARIRIEHGISSGVLKGWIQANLFGKEAAAALAQVLKDQEDQLKKTRAQFTETGLVVSQYPTWLAAAAQATRAFGVDASAMGDSLAFKNLADGAKTLGKVIGGELGRAIDYVEPKADGLFEGLVRGADRARTRVERYEESFEALKKTMDKIVNITSAAFGQMDAIVAQSQRNREIAIENEYKKRLDAINRSTQDEEAKQKAIAALEAEFQIKRTSANRAAAKQQKAIALMEAITNTAAGVAGALSNKPWTPFNFVLAAITAALGAVQIGLIAAQPIPLAKGALFTRPTLLPATTGQAYRTEETAEIVSPEPMMRRIVREESRTRSSVVVNINGPLVQTTGLSDADVRRAGNRFKAEIDWQMRRLGRATNG